MDHAATNSDDRESQRGFIPELIGDGRPLIIFTGLALGMSGLFALFLSLGKQFLPHDVAFLGMTPEMLCSVNQCRIVHFMFHDRVSFGGALVAIASIYLWLATFPLRQRKAWAWYTLLISSVLGFGSFLAYLGYGYLDTWHGSATLALLPVFILGMARSYFFLEQPARFRSLLKPGIRTGWTSAYGVGRCLLLATTIAMAAGGLTIMTIGATTVFVPQDLAFMGLDASELQAINPHLVPLIAHDRAGFGGGVCCCGITMFLCIWCSPPTRSLWQALLIAGIAGFGTAIGVHPAIGYTDTFHLLPAYAGATMFALGLALTYRRMCGSPPVETMPPADFQPSAS